MERVVYLLGAGFSVPLGLPLTANFLRKAWDIEDSHPDFKSVRETIRDLSFASNFYNVDMNNVEELFSILEMRELLTKESERKKFAKFIADVIQHYTPDVQQLNSNQDERKMWQFNLLGLEQHKGYTGFVASLFNLYFKKTGTNVGYEREKPPKVYYSVITLNYDLVLERFASLIRGSSVGDSTIEFSREDGPEDEFPVFLAKLHGSAENPANIIPPTWNKVLDERTVGQWKLAHRLLESATQIRIIGYSLPVADSYIKYLLKSAVVKSKNLKRVDVLCRQHVDDPAFKRYKDFIREAPHLHFPSHDVFRTEQYLSRLFGTLQTGGDDLNCRSAIEEAHFQIFPRLD